MSDDVKETKPSNFAAQTLIEKAEIIESYATLSHQRAAELEYEAAEIQGQAKQEREKAYKVTLMAQELRAAALSLSTFKEADS